MITTELPRLYGPKFRKLLLPVALALLATLILLLGTNTSAPGWFQAFVVITWIGVAGSRSSFDGSGNILRQALAFSGQLLGVIMLALFVAFDVLGKGGSELNGQHVLLLSLLFSVLTEGVYSFLQRDTLGWRWLIGCAPTLLWAVLTDLLLQ